MTIIRPDSISEDTILRDLRAYLLSRPDADRWRDYFAGGSGATLLELISGLGGFLSYQARAARQESNLLTARLASSIYAAAFTFGYPINRKQSAVISVTGNLNNDDYTNSRKSFIRQYEPYLTNHLSIGTIDGYEISFPLGYDLGSKAPPTSGDVVLDGLLVGEWDYHVHTIRESTTFYEVPIPLETTIENIDNVEVHVWHNRGGTHTPDTDIITGGTTTKFRLTRNTEDMEGTAGSETALIKTLINNVSIMFGSDAIGYKPQAGDIVLIRYLEIKEPVTDSTPNFVLENLRLEESSLTPTGVVVTRRQTEEDSFSKIAKVVPGYFSSKRRMVTDNDHVSIFNSMPGIRDSKFVRKECSTKVYEIDNEDACTVANGVWRQPNEIGHDCCTYLMTYLRDDGNVMSNAEEEEVRRRLKEFQIVGENLLFRPASPVYIDVLMNVGANPYPPVRDLNEAIREAIELQCYKIGGTFDTAQLIRDVNAIEGIARSDIKFPNGSKTLSSNAYFAPGIVGGLIVEDSKFTGEFKDTTDRDLRQTPSDIIGYRFPPHFAPSGRIFITNSLLPEVRESVNTDISEQLPLAYSNDDIIYSVETPANMSFDVETRMLTGRVTTPILDGNYTYKILEKNTGYSTQIQNGFIITA